MANHVHRQIREGFESCLTGLTTSGLRVYANRLYVLPADSQPALRVYADSETVEPLTVHAPHMQDRALAVVVECCAKAAATLDDTLDLMSKEVETALAAGISVTGQTLYPVYQGMAMDLEPGATPVGVKRLRYAVSFETLNNAPDTFT